MPVTIRDLVMPQLNAIRDDVMALAAMDVPFPEIEKRLSDDYSPFLIKRAIWRLRYDEPGHLLRWLQDAPRTGPRKFVD